MRGIFCCFSYLIITVILTALFFTTLAIVTVFCITRLLHRPKDQTQHPQLHQLNHTPPSHQSQLQTCLTLELNGTGSPSPLTPDQSGISEVDSCNPAERYGKIVVLTSRYPPIIKSECKICQSNKDLQRATS